DWRFGICKSAGRQSGSWTSGIFNQWHRLRRNWRVRKHTFNMPDRLWREKNVTANRANFRWHVINDDNATATSDGVNDRFLLIFRALPRQLAVQVIHLLRNLAVAFAVAIHGADGVQDGGVIAAAEVAADFFQAVARVPTRQVHADLSREGDALVATLALEIG